jgi:hypothetical protein
MLCNRYREGLVIAGYGSGHIRLFSVDTGSIKAEITAHAGKKRYLVVMLVLRVLTIMTEFFLLYSKIPLLCYYKYSGLQAKDFFALFKNCSF